MQLREQNNRNPEIQQQSCCSGLRTDRSDLYRCSSYNGCSNICAVDGNEKRLEFAKRMGADTTVNFMNFKGIEALAEAVKEAQGGHLADFAFQCTGNPHAHANISTNLSATAAVFASLVSSSTVEMLPSTRTSTSAPKRSTLVGSWVYNLRDYATTFDFLKRANAIGLPMSELITHKFPLEEINEALKTNLAMTGLKIAIVKYQITLTGKENAKWQKL